MASTVDDVVSDHPYLEHADALGAIEYVAPVVIEREVPVATCRSASR